MKVAVTGANGYLGSKIVEYFSLHGVEVLKLVRNCYEKNSHEFVLGNTIDQKFFAGVDCLIHVAHDFSVKNWNEAIQTNVNGARLLFDSANLAGVKRIIFISSMSSFENCKSIYGKAKFLIENELIGGYGGYIIRPGLICDQNHNGGMVGTLQKIVKIPIIPLIGGNVLQYLCDSSDLCDLLHSICMGKQEQIQNQPIIAANKTPYTFKHILKLMGAKILVPVPWRIVYFMLCVLEFLGIRPRTGSDNLISLINQNPNPNFSVTEVLEIKFKNVILRK